MCQLSYVPLMQYIYPELKSACYFYFRMSIDDVTGLEDGNNIFVIIHISYDNGLAIILLLINSDQIVQG